MNYDERWNTCGVDRMEMWPSLVRGGFLFTRKEDDVADMLKKPGSTYSGVATVIWDSEV